jgi:plastin-1
MLLNTAGRKIEILNALHMIENNKVVIESAKAIGCSVVNIGASDVTSVREHVILDLIWQIIRRGLLRGIDLRLCPELYRLLEDEIHQHPAQLRDDGIYPSTLQRSPKQFLLRWFNYHLKAAGWTCRFVYLAIFGPLSHLDMTANSL